MALPDSDKDMQDALTALNTLISGRARKDGQTWETAFDYMKVYLEVRLPLLGRGAALLGLPVLHMRLVSS
jgi:hypothetical protein